MDIERVKELLSALADGVDPLTGEVLDRDNVCNRPEIIRALHMALYELDKREKKTVKSICLRTPGSRGRRKTRTGFAKCSTPVRQGGSFANISSARKAQ